LQLKVQQEREKHMEQTSQAIASNSDSVTRPTVFDVNDRFVLSTADSSYHLSIEVQTAIDHIVLQV